MYSMFELFKQYINIELLYTILSWVIMLAPIWGPIVLGFVAWDLWVRYKRASFFFHKNKYIVLEIKLPRETLKTPLAMELFLNSLHQTSGEANWYAKYIEGKTRAWFSLELVSIEGQVRFFIWTRSNWKNLIESGLYAQYPEIEIYEVPDYTRSVHFDPKEMTLWASDFDFSKPDPYPIKTYIDYNLDKETEEEFKVDPMAPMIEFLGSLGKNQQVWIQFIIRAHRDEYRKPGHWFAGTDPWKDAAKKEIEKIRAEATSKYVDENGKEKPGFPNPTKGQTELIAALERSISKYGFDVGIRGMYIAKKDSFNGMNIPGLIGCFKQFGSEQWNSFKPKRWLNGFDYPWMDFRDMRQNWLRGLALDAYKRRSYFFEPYKTKWNILNTEELATMYHFPGSTVKTPTLTRVMSKKSEAPANLPR